MRSSASSRGSWPAISTPGMPAARARSRSSSSPLPTIVRPSPPSGNASAQPSRRTSTPFSGPSRARQTNPRPGPSRRSCCSVDGVVLDDQPVGRPARQHVAAAGEGRGQDVGVHRAPPGARPRVDGVRRRQRQRCRARLAIAAVAHGRQGRRGRRHSSHTWPSRKSIPAGHSGRKLWSVLTTRTPLPARGAERGRREQREGVVEVHDVGAHRRRSARARAASRRRATRPPARAASPCGDAASRRSRRCPSAARARRARAHAAARSSSSTTEFSPLGMRAAVAVVDDQHPHDARSLPPRASSASDMPMKLVFALR